MVTTLVYSNRAMQRKDSYSSGNRRNSFLTAPVSFFKQGKKQTETYRQSDTLTPFLKGNRIRTCIAAPDVTLFTTLAFLSFHGCCYCCCCLLKQNYTVSAHCFYAVEIILNLFVRFALKQKNQKFKTWKLRLKIGCTL